MSRRRKATYFRAVASQSQSMGQGSRLTGRSGFTDRAYAASTHPIQINASTRKASRRLMGFTAPGAS